MKLKHLLFIVNEHSRKGKKFTRQLHRIMKNYDISYDVHLTEYKKHGVELARQFTQTIDEQTLIIAVGGDGTLNEVIAGSVSTNIDVPIAYIPTGSGNDFARARKLSKNIETNIKRILSIKEPTELDILTTEANHEPIVAVNSVGFGLDGRVIYKLGQNKNKETIGKISYLLTVLSAYFSQKPFPITIKSSDKSYHFDDTFLVVFANHKNFAGGIPIHPLALATDEIIDVVVLKNVNFIELLKLIFKVLVNESHLSHKKVHSFRDHSWHLTLHTPQYGQRDGEVINEDTYTMTIKTRKKKFWL